MKSKLQGDQMENYPFSSEDGSGRSGQWGWGHGREELSQTWQAMGFQS